jgi:hypothetical protein
VRGSSRCMRTCVRNASSRSHAVQIGSGTPPADQMRVRRVGRHLSGPSRLAHHTSVSADTLASVRATSDTVLRWAHVRPPQNRSPSPSSETRRRAGIPDRGLARQPAARDRGRSTPRRVSVTRRAEPRPARWLGRAPRRSEPPSRFRRTRPSARRRRAGARRWCSTAHGSGARSSPRRRRACSARRLGTPRHGVHRDACPRRPPRPTQQREMD